MVDRVRLKWTSLDRTDNPAMRNPENVQQDSPFRKRVV
jgi:hypothetical protein